MGKTRRKSHSEVEHLRGENKKLKSLVRSLQREVRDLQKKSHFFEEIVEDATEDIDLIIHKSCEACGKDVGFEVLDLKYVKYEVCLVCRVKTKI